MAAVVPTSTDNPDVGLSASLVRDAEYFSRILTGWGRELTDEHDSPIPFSASALTELITSADGYQFSVALFTAEGQIRYGNAPEKNLSTSPAPGDGAGEVAAAVSAAVNSPTT